MRMLIVGVVFGVTLQMVGAQSPTPPLVRPPDEIPLARLTPDVVLRLGVRPGAVATVDGVWLPGPTGATLVTAATNQVAAHAATAEPPCASLGWAFGALWVPQCGRGALARVDDKTRAGTVPGITPLADPQGRLATMTGSLWMASDAKGVISRVDPDTGGAVAEVYVGGQPSSLAAGDDALWVTSAANNSLARVNPHTNVIVETVTVGPRPGRLAVGEGGVWTLNRGDGSVTRVDPKTNKVVATIAVGAWIADGEIAAGEGAAWLSAPGAPLVRIDPRTNRAAQRFTGDGGGAVLVAHGSLWVAASQTETWRLDPRLVAAMRPN